MTVDSMYSIQVTSKFKLFYDEAEEGEDPNDMISRIEAEAKSKPKTKTDKGEKKKGGKDAPKKTESKENVSVRPEKPVDKKGKRPDKKDEKPPRFANRQNRDGESGQQRDDRETESRENSGPPRGRGGFRGDRGGNRGGYRGRGGGFRGGRDGGQGPRPNGTGGSDEWNVQGSDNHTNDGWGAPASDNDTERRTEGYRGGGRGGRGGFGRGGSSYSDRGFSDRGSGYRGGRGGQRGGFRNAGREGGREYERHSGSYKTGVKPVDKRDGAGAHNWGTMKDELDVSANEAVEGQSPEWTNKESAQPGQTETTDESTPAATEEAGEEGETSAVPEENVPITMTLDEYRAQQAKKKAELAEALKHAADESRKINDGQDAFKNMVRYQKEKLDDDEDEEEEEDEDEDDEEAQRSKQIVIDVRFSDAPRRGGGRFTGERGGRGRGGGDRGRGCGFRGGRGNFRGGYERPEGRQFSNDRPNHSRSQQAQIRLNDENDFPSLK